jgi:hypothetical protein
MGPDAGFEDLPLRGNVTSSPMIGPDGAIYLGAADGGFVAFKGTNAPASSCWPTFRGNLTGTGRPSPGKTQ